MRSSKQRLGVDNTIALDFYLAGIVSGLRDYKFCSMLNRDLQLNLYRSDDVIIRFSNPSKSHKHKRYLYITEYGEEYQLIANKGEKYQLIPEHKNIDYFLLVRSLAQDADYYLLLDNLRKLQSVLGAFDIDPANLKSKHNLLF